VTRRLRPSVRRGLTWASAAAVIVAAVIGSGVIPIASSGHWRVTSTLLDFVKRRSVALRAAPLTAPDLTVPSLVDLGAAHYEAGCRPCHGRPGLVLPLVPRRMTPHPPDLQRQVERWSAEELFYLVKHGIKFTGMPAWPYADRDDEVWAVVAFVRGLPSLDGPAYERMTALGTARPAAASDVEQAARGSCERCHGAGGLGRGLVPRLAGQRATYLRDALDAYASGARRSGIMGPVAASLRANEVATLGAYYAALAPMAPEAPIAPEREGSDAANTLTPRELGASIAAAGRVDQDVPACGVCHPTGAAAAVNPAFPRIAGLAAEYVELQLRLFAESRRGGGPFAGVMREVATGLTAEQRRHVAVYYASQR